MITNNVSQAPLQLPCSVVILSARAGKEQGAMTATAMYVSEKPPLLAVSVSKTLATYQLIEKSREFALNVVADNQLELAARFGAKHGYEVDKFKAFGVTTQPATKVSAPLLKGCFAYIECKVKTSLWDVDGDHAIYIAEVVAFGVEEKLQPLVWLKRRYFKVGTECRL